MTTQANDSMYAPIMGLNWTVRWVPFYRSGEWYGCQGWCARVSWDHAEGEGWPDASGDPSQMRKFLKGVEAHLDDTQPVTFGPKRKVRGHAIWQRWPLVGGAPFSHPVDADYLAAIEVLAGPDGNWRMLPLLTPGLSGGHSPADYGFLYIIDGEFSGIAASRVRKVPPANYAGKAVA